jgi:hypothetical protein
VRERERDVASDAHTLVLRRARIVLVLLAEALALTVDRGCGRSILLVAAVVVRRDE